MRSPLPFQCSTRPLTDAAWLFLAIAVALVGSVVSAEPVAVEIADGRVFVGEVCPWTDSDHLWLRSGRQTAFVDRPLDWSCVLHVTTQGKTLSASEFRQLAQSRTWREANRLTIEKPKPTAFRAATRPAEVEEELAAPADWTPRVSSLHLEARLGKWDAGAGMSGLVINAYPVDIDDNILPLRGTLDVELLVLRPAGNGREYYEELGRWCVAVEPEQFGVNGAVARLPFQTFDTDFVSAFGINAIVVGRLTVPGEGVFEDSTDVVRTRSFIPVRDSLQLLR